MAKYRALTIDELQSMEKEFVEFLAANGIPGDDWVKIKDSDPDKADGICEAFSDVVFTKILKKCRYVERHTKHHVASIFCDEKTMFLLGIEAPEDSPLDFTNSAFFEELKTNPPKGLKLFKSEKSYSKNREDEIWDMLNNGFFISDQQLYMSLFSSAGPKTSDI